MVDSNITDDLDVYRGEVTKTVLSGWAVRLKGALRLNTPENRANDASICPRARRAHLCETLPKRG